MHFHLICEVFWAENQKNSKGVKFIKYDEETQCFDEKKMFSFKMASLPKWESAKYARGSRPSY